MNRLYILLMINLFLSIGCAQKTPEHYKVSIEEHRVNYKHDFESNERAPLTTKAELDLMDFYPADISYVCDCDIVLDEARKVFDMATYAGTTKEFVTYARAKCSLQGNKITLNLYQSANTANHPLYGKNLFLPFKDYTNGETTYGGGRYIDIAKDSIKNGKLIIDFNHCYNPWCAYADGYSCPVPPTENHLEIKVEAGEKNYKGDKKY